MTTLDPHLKTSARSPKAGKFFFSFYTLLIFLCIFHSSLLAQVELNNTSVKLPGEAPLVRFEHIGLEDGLVQQSIYTITQDRQGYLWMTNQGGLHRYDGYEFKVYTSTPFDTTSISSNFITSVTEAANGNLWLTVDRDGLDFMDRASETFINYSHDPADPTSLSSNRTFDVEETINGDVWVSTFDKGLNRMKAGETGKFIRYRHDPKDANSLTSDNLYFISEDANGKIWVGSMNGLNRIDPETGLNKRFLYEPGVPEEFGNPQNVYDHYFPPEEPNIVWLATGEGLVRLNTETGSYERFNKDKDDFFKIIHTVIPDPSEPGILWAGGPDTGVIRFNISTGEFTSYRHDPKDRNSLRENDIFTLFADRSGNIWVGHISEGLSKFNPGAVNFSHLRHNPEDPESLAPGAVWAIYEDREKTLWVSTFQSKEGAYLTEFNTKTGKIKRHKYESEIAQMLPFRLYTSIAEDEEDNFWVGGTLGLSLLDRKTGQVQQFYHHPHEDNIDRNNIRAIVAKNKGSGQLYLGSAAGLDLFNIHTGKFEPIEHPSEDKQKNLSVAALYLSKDGILWIGSTRGLYKLNQEGKVQLVSAYNALDTTTISSNYVAGILERVQEPGILWLATFGGGLNRFDTRTGTARHYLEKDGLSNSTIYGVLEDSKGTLWLSTNRGISNFDPETETFRNYTMDDGLIALEYNQFGYSKGADGTMYFGSKEGVTAFNPEKLSVNENPPQVLISNFRIFNKEVLPGKGSPLERPLAETEKISIDYDLNEITFDFVALHYGNPSKNSYAYILEGFDRDWVEAGTKRSATYTNLEPGDYIFKVKAANADGIWNIEPATVALSVLPPWYRTWWAYLLFGLLLAAVVFAVDRFQRKKLRKKEQERAALREAELKAEAENRRRADTEQLSNIGRAITSSLSITDIIEIVYGHVNELMDAACFGVGIYNPDRNRLDFPATKEDGQMLPRYSHRLDEENRLAVWCFNNRKEIIIDNAAKESGKYINKYLPPVTGKESKSILYLPLVQHNRTIGVITVQSFKENAYTPYHVQLFRNLATYAAIALDNASAYRRLNATLKELQVMQEQLVQQEKLASLGQLTAGIAHEIKNPLNFVTNFSELSLEMLEEVRDEFSNLEVTSEKARAKISEIYQLLENIEANQKKIHKHGTRADGIVRSMLQHSRGGSGKMEPTDINSLISEYVNLAFHGMRAGKNPINVEIDLQLDEDAGKVPLIAEDFSRVIINLCNNAFEAMREKSKLPSVNGSYLPKLTVRTLRKNGVLNTEIEDNGPGIPEAIKPKILQPFFTTKRGTDGTGLGLSITHDIIKAHKGELNIITEEGAFSKFIVQIPTN